MIVANKKLNKMKQTQKGNNYKKNRLSPIDKQIIGELIDDPRKSISDISRNINKTRTTTTKRLKNLIKNNIIKIDTNIKLDHLNINFYLLRITLKRREHIDSIVKFLEKCPKILNISITLLNNILQVIVFNENDILMKNNVFTCMHMIEHIKADQNIEECKFEAMINLLLPQYINLENFQKELSKSSKNIAPCGIDCLSCSKYQKICHGCPTTEYYNGYLKF
ncbi:MAG: winged helix-turn-helix transcriptional regulator [Promethearchaeota archaeon]